MTLPRTRPALWFEAMEEGKVAYFRKGKLIVGPRRPDPRTYAEAAAADDKTETPEVELNFVKQVEINCEDTVAVRIDKSVSDADKDVLLFASYVVPENSPVYDTLELKDGILSIVLLIHVCF